MARRRVIKHDPFASYRQTLEEAERGGEEVGVGESNGHRDDINLQMATQSTELAGKRVYEYALDELWLEAQPRELVPEEQLQRLIHEGRAQPRALLEVLEWSAAADPYYAEVLEGLRGLASSIAAQGVLQPIGVVAKAKRLVVRDGHRRSLASLLAGKTTVPGIQIEEPGELEAIARAFVVNIQRQDLTAIEKGAALLRLALVVGRHLAEEQGGDPAAVTIGMMLGEGEEAGDSAIAETPEVVDEKREVRRDSTIAESPVGGRRRRAGTGLPYGFAGQVRQRILALTGLSQSSYYAYIKLNQLTPEARALGRGLPEGRLRPIVALPPARQAEVIAFAQRHRLADRELKSLAQVIRRGEEDEVQRIMARLRREQAGEARTTVSWQPLVNAIPEDYVLRGEALRAELAALTPKLRQQRVAQLRQQMPRLVAVQALFQQLIAEHDKADDPSTSEAGGLRATAEEIA